MEAHQNHFLRNSNPMSTKKEKYVCNQCSRCAVENTAVLGCVDDDCPCHLQSESIEWEEVQEVHSEVIKVMESIGFGLLLDGQTFYKKGYELKPREHTTFSMTQAYEIKNAITTAVAKAGKKAYAEGFEDGCKAH